MTARVLLLRCMYFYLHIRGGGFGVLGTDGHVVARARGLVGGVERKGSAWRYSLLEYLLVPYLVVASYRTCSGVTMQMDRFHGCPESPRVETMIGRTSD